MGIKRAGKCSEILMIKSLENRRHGNYEEQFRKTD